MPSPALLALAALSLVALPTPPVPKPKPAVTLKVGDAAPPLAVSKWLQGAEVKAFAPGEVYVVEFWAAWCGPCIAAMPELARLQAEYRDKHVTVIGFTSRDLLGKPGHGEKQAAEFVARRGKAFDYRFAYADDDATAQAWLAAAGREGIPCSFVVDKAGRIAYIGHPMYLPAVLPRVVEGKATAAEVGAAMAAIEAEFRAFSGTKVFTEPRASLQALKAFEAEHPELADFLPAMKIKLSMLPKHGAPGEAKTYAEALTAKAIERKDLSTLGLVAALLRRGDGKESRDLLAVAVKAAEAAVRLDGGAEAGSLLDLADAHFVSGDAAKAKEYAGRAKAVAGAEPAMREYVLKEAARLGSE